MDSQNTASSVGIGLGSLNTPERKVYNVGDTIKLVNYGFSMSEYEDGLQVLHTGNQIFEVEIKSIKTAKTVLE